MLRKTVLRAAAGALVAAPFANLASAQDLRPFRIGLSEGDDATPTLYAIQNGLFKKYGIDAQLTPVASGAAGLAALAAGRSTSPARACCRFFRRVPKACR